MRLWLRDSERRPDPVPVRTDARKAILAGIGTWLLGLAALLVFFNDLISHDIVWWVWTTVIGIGLGVVGLIFLTIKRR